MTHLDSIFSNEALQDMLDSNFVRIQYHPTFPFAILNYTNAAQTSRLWNDVTKNCRGLIINVLNNKVIGRPFPKFFNYGEESQQKRKWYPNEPVIVTDKMDGSLGISYRGTDGKPYIATRGSFMSDQALRATKILHKKYPEWSPDEGLTYLFEIIYPENRIVVDYGQTEDLILLGAVNIETGVSVDPGIARLNWSGPVVEIFHYKSFQEALEAAPRPNSEGLVVHFLNSDQRVKLKQEDYVNLHRIVSNLDAQVVWEYLKESKSIMDLVDSLPEEFESWIYETMTRLLDSYHSIKQFIEVLVEGWLCDIRDNGLELQEGRKYFAQCVAQSVEKELAAAFFAYFDGNTERAKNVIWNSIKPPKEKVRRSGRQTDESS